MLSFLCTNFVLFGIGFRLNLPSAFGRSDCVNFHVCRLPAHGSAWMQVPLLGSRPQNATFEHGPFSTGSQSLHWWARAFGRCFSTIASIPLTWIQFSNNFPSLRKFVPFYLLVHVLLFVLCLNSFFNFHIRPMHTGCHPPFCNLHAFTYGGAQVFMCFCRLITCGDTEGLKGRKSHITFHEYFCITPWTWTIWARTITN